MVQVNAVAVYIMAAATLQVRLIAAKHGLHAKLTGAGGGGCAFVLLHPGLSNEPTWLRLES